MGHRLLALMEAYALVVVPFCYHELVLVLVVRQPGCHISKTWVVADACWPSAEDRVSLCNPCLCKRVERILPFLHVGGRMERILLFVGFVPYRLGLWDGVVTREEVNRRDRPVGSHCQLPVQYNVLRHVNVAFTELVKLLAIILGNVPLHFRKR